MNVDSVVTHAVAAIAVIIGVSYLVGRLFRRLRQPEVMGQLLAGIALGPSLLGRYGVPLSHALFPASVIPYLNVISQVALVLFLFAVGYEIDLRVLQRYRRAVVPVISATTFAVPAILGIGSVFVLRNLYHSIGEPRSETLEFTLFVGLALSITAVPVLACIVGERGMAASGPGVIALTSAALIDLLGWLMLAAVLVLASASSAGHRPWSMTVLLLALYLAVGLFVVRPALRALFIRPGAVPAGYVPVAVVVAMGSAWATAVLGLHVIFGAFFAGLIMPRTGGVPDAELLRPLSQAGRLLLPVFFMVAGLSVDIGALRWHDLIILGATCLLAVSGKAGAGFLAGRGIGLRPRDAMAVGILLNARGLTELIALNIGLQTGLIHARLYTILVLMALVMTMLTGPLLELVCRPEAGSADTAQPERELPRPGSIPERQISPESVIGARAEYATPAPTRTPRVRDRRP